MSNFYWGKLNLFKMNSRIINKKKYFKVISLGIQVKKRVCRVKREMRLRKRINKCVK